MEETTLKKDLFLAVSLALAIHLCLAFIRISADRPAFSVKTDHKQSLAVSFVSTFKEIEKKPLIRPVIEEKERVIVEEKRPAKKQSAREENSVLPPPESDGIKPKETQPVVVMHEKASPAPSLIDTHMQKSIKDHPVTPRYLENPPPVYPPVAKRRGYEGTVLLSVKIRAGGTVSELKIKESSGYSILDRAAVEAVKKWRFDIPFSMWVDVPVRFVLN